MTEASKDEAVTNRFQLDETLDISIINDLYNKLKDSSQQTDTIEVDAGKVQRIDTAALQLLYSWYTSEKKKGTKIVWKNTGGTFYQSARLLGLHELLKITDI
ncbi:MAG: STAS domain-containing protein [Gammaproteobacteria bacterium]|jgi:ABC-type transporter Mla MlaB component